MNEKEQTLTGYPSIDKPWLKYYSDDASEYVADEIRESAYQYILQANKNNLDYMQKIF